MLKVLKKFDRGDSNQSPFDRNLHSLRRHALMGTGLIAALVVGLGGWSATARVESAVVSSGVVVVEGGSRKVQHPEGGVVKQILVRNNEVVEAGQLLVTLDDVYARAELEVVMAQLREALGAKARLTAESTGEAAMEMPALPGTLAVDPKLRVVMGEQQRLMRSRKASQDSAAARINELITEKRSVITGYESQLEAFDSQLKVVREELNQLQTLQGKELVSNQRVNEMKRSEAELSGQIASVRSSISATESSIAELRMQSDQTISDFRAEAQSQLQTTSQQVAELMEKQLAAQARLSRLEIRAPVAGTIHEAAVHTIGGVVAPGDTLMLVVPEPDHLVIDTRVSPLEVSRLHVGQAAEVRLLNFDANSTPALAGSVDAISPDLLQDRATGVQYYSVRVDIADAEMAKLPAGADLVPGMPAESFFQTGERTVWSYLMGPVEARFRHTFREK